MVRVVAGTVAVFLFLASQGMFTWAVYNMFIGEGYDIGVSCFPFTAAAAMVTLHGTSATLLAATTCGASWD